MWRILRQHPFLRSPCGNTSAASPRRNRDTVSSSNTPIMKQEIPYYKLSTGTAAIVALIVGLDGSSLDSTPKTDNINNESKKGRSSDSDCVNSVNNDLLRHGRISKKNAKYMGKRQRYKVYTPAHLDNGLQHYYSPQTSNKVASCESNEAGHTHDIEYQQFNDPAHDKKQTFRRRRLTLHSSLVDGDDSGTDNDDKNSPSPLNPCNMHVMYSTEIEEEDEEKDEMLKQHQLFVRRNTKSSPTIEPKDLNTKQLPFSKDQVGTFSCHGIEPLSHIDADSYNESKNNTNGQAFLSSMIFGSSSTPPDQIIMTEHKTNQDRGHVVYPYANQSRMALFGAYDGHGEKGELVAEHTMNSLSDELHNFIIRTFPSGECIPNEGRKHYISQALHSIVRGIDNDLNGRSYLHSSHSGTTACIVLMKNKTLWVANVGDSRAVLGSRRGQAANDQVTQDIRRGIRAESNGMESPFPVSMYLKTIQLTKDQNALDKEERDRIIKSGGYVTMPSEEGLPARVWLDERCSQIGLAMSRSIGDHILKNVGVIADPEIKTFDLTEEDEFFIIGTDGIWEFISSDEAVYIIQNCFEKGMGASDACKELIQVAMKRWQENEGDYRDDITAIVVRLSGIWDDD